MGGVDVVQSCSESIFEHGADATGDYFEGGLAKICSSLHENVRG